MSSDASNGPSVPSSRGSRKGEGVILDLSRPGVVDLLCNFRALGTWEVLRRYVRAAARADLAQAVGLSEPETQRDLDLLAGFGLAVRVPASRHLRAGGWRVACQKIVVLLDPASEPQQALLARVVEEFSERSIQVIRRVNRGPGQLARRRIKRAFNWLHVTDEEFDEVRMLLRSFDALVKRIESRQLRHPMAPTERPNLHLALCVSPLDPETPPVPPIQVTTAADLQRDRQVDQAQQMDALSPREREVTMLLLSGLTEKEAAARLGLSPGTVRTHVVHAYQKLGVKRRSELSARVLGLAK